MEHLNIGDKVKFVKKTHRLTTTTNLFSVGILSDKTDESVLNCYVVFHTDEGLFTDWFNEEELEKVGEQHEH